jgi:phosphoribosylaminoimidazolecarboxamide formyltransferase/IMP cyclohydrolase
MNKKVTRALISVSDKNGIVPLARALKRHGVEIIASDGTGSELAQAGIAFNSIESITGFAHLFSGRVKTLHPNIHGAILADLDDPEHQNSLLNSGITPIDLVIVNLYQPEFFDIGGPALIRAAAKNYQHVALLTSPDQYQELIDSLETGTNLSQRQKWARQGIYLTAKYDLGILSQLAHPLRYGENPHQLAGIFGDGGVAAARVLQGKEMSYNNYLDADAAWKLANLWIEEKSVAIIKHGNPTGVSISHSAVNAFESAWQSDPISAFGSVVAINSVVDLPLAEKISEVFIEVIIAPEFTQEAINVLSKKTKLRLLQLKKKAGAPEQIREIHGGFLFQEVDTLDEHDLPTSWRLVAGNQVDTQTLADLSFAWFVVTSVRSNAIVIAGSDQSGVRSTLGIGMGQVNRRDAAEQAVQRASKRAVNAVAASDAFFPFPDGLDLLIKAGIRAVVAPGGSVNDAAVVELAQQAGISLYFTDRRHFLH